MSAVSLHRLAELRSIAYHRAVADRLRENPELVDKARARLDDWDRDRSAAPYYIRRWREVLTGGREELLAFLTSDTEDARALRQSTPFAGFIDPQERLRIWREVREQVLRGEGSSG